MFSAGNDACHPDGSEVGIKYYSCTSPHDGYTTDRYCGMRSSPQFLAQDRGYKSVAQEHNNQFYGHFRGVTVFVLGHYTAYVSSCLSTFRDRLSVPYSGVKQCVWRIYTAGEAKTSRKLCSIVTGFAVHVSKYINMRMTATLTFIVRTLEVQISGYYGVTDNIKTDGKMIFGNWRFQIDERRSVSIKMKCSHLYSLVRSHSLTRLCVRVVYVAEYAVSSCTTSTPEFNAISHPA
jgi:hypothetical protein